jgi:anti-sigma factor RsiW
MNHDETAKLLGPYRDGELDLATCLKLEEHLAGCPSCQEKLTGEQEMIDLIQSEAPRFKASPFLKTRIRAALRETAKPKWKWTYPIPLAFYELGILGSIAVIALLAFVITPAALWLFSTSDSSRLAQEAVSDHVRSLQVDHLMDVASTDQHTVKPWFAGKLDYSPQVVDLGPSGYPLIGGRLDVLDHRNVAAIIYQRRKHYINLFIWPSGTELLHHRLYNQNGYHVLGWTKSGMNYLAVSELGEKEFGEFAQMIQDQTVDSRPGE